jgi:hypothetical protein|nr:MAG TPA: hypothetical protein [Bacteriophage sp.]
MYPLKVNIIFVPDTLPSVEIQENAKSFHTYFRILLGIYKIDVSLSEEFYHPDEEAEMNGVDYVKYNFHIDTSVNHSSSLVNLTLILSHTVSLLNRRYGNSFEIEFLS